MNVESNETILDEILNSLSIKDKIDQNIFSVALTHKSFANESFYSFKFKQKHPTKKNPDAHIPVLSYNERLEFLGDSLLGFHISYLLYKRYPDLDEGKLSMLKARAVCEPTLAEIGNSLSLSQIIRLGKGADLGNINYNNAIIANTIEAIIAAIFLSCGLDHTSKFIEKLWKPYLEDITSLPSDSLDYKSILQEISVKQYKKIPTYTLLEVHGKQHKKLYTVMVYTDSDKKKSYGEDTSIKKSEQKSAKSYLDIFFPEYNII